ncbi:Uncharacterised protein [Shigella sonnei]|nr:Uncharacterised protein [Shigella sonnei]CST18359.1 Uncharacterised protein [Shigella sonnei]
MLTAGFPPASFLQQRHPKLIIAFQTYRRCICEREYLFAIAPCRSRYHCRPVLGKNGQQRRTLRQSGSRVRDVNLASPLRAACWVNLPWCVIVGSLNSRSTGHQMRW